ncbi:MAG: glycosyltransferase [Candidatus Micrarchaeia archaeon]
MNSDALRLGLFTDTWLPNVDGVVNSIISQRRELEARGNIVYVFASGTTHEKKQNADAHVFVHTGVRLPPYPQYKIAVFPFPTALKQAHDAHLDLVHCHAIASMGTAAIAAAKFNRVPLVGTFHTMIPQTAGYVTRNRLGKELLSKAVWKAVEIFYLPFDCVIAPSHAVKRELDEHGIRNVVVVPNGIDIERFNPKVNGARVRAKLKAGKRKIVLVAGRMGFEKNIEVLIRAAPRVVRETDALFVFAGKGPAKTRCERLVDEAGLGKNAVFAGFVPDAELPEYYAACDVFATASTFETQCLALYEAMGCGKPVVGANALAIPEAVKNGKNGFVFESGNSDDCTEKLERVLSGSPAECKAWGENARRSAEGMSVEAGVDKLVKVYRGNTAARS